MPTSEERAVLKAMEYLGKSKISTALTYIADNLTYMVKIDSDYVFVDMVGTNTMSLEIATMIGTDISYSTIKMMIMLVGEEQDIKRINQFAN